MAHASGRTYRDPRYVPAFLEAEELRRRVQALEAERDAALERARDPVARTARLSAEVAFLVGARMRALDLIPPLAQEMLVAVAVTQRLARHAERCHELLRAVGGAGPEELEALQGAVLDFLSESRNLGALKGAVSGSTSRLSEGFAALMAALVVGREVLPEPG